MAMADSSALGPSNRKTPLVLVTNDDGYLAEGINSVVDALLEFADVIVVAPAKNQSAKSFSLSLGVPLELEDHSPAVSKTENGRILRVYSVSGTPVDCVIMAFHHVLPLLGFDKPDLVVSGLNHGANLGGDVLVSGTVAAAVYASFHYNVAAVAGSVVHQSATSQPYSPLGPVKETLNFSTGARFLSGFCRQLLSSRDRHADTVNNTVFNINVPNHTDADLAPKQYAVTDFGSVNYIGPCFIQKDTSSNIYYLAGTPAFADFPGSDCNAVMEGKISVTPMSVRSAAVSDVLPGGGEAPTSRAPRPAASHAGLTGPGGAVTTSNGPFAETAGSEAAEASSELLPRHPVLKRARHIQPTALVCTKASAWLQRSFPTIGAFRQTPSSPSATARWVPASSADSLESKKLKSTPDTVAAPAKPLWKVVARHVGLLAIGAAIGAAVVSSTRCQPKK